MGYIQEGEAAGCFARALACATNGIQAGLWQRLWLRAQNGDEYRVAALWRRGGFIEGIVLWEGA